MIVYLNKSVQHFSGVKCKPRVCILIYVELFSDNMLCFLIVAVYATLFSKNYVCTRHHFTPQEIDYFTYVKQQPNLVA